MMQGWGPQGGQPPFPEEVVDYRSDNLIRYTTSQEDFLKKPNAWSTA